MLSDVLVPKKNSPEAAIGSATHRLTLEIASNHAKAWKSFSEEIDAWWPRDFRATGEPQRMVLELKLGGRLYEDAGDGNGLVWYQVIALDAPRSVLLAGFVAPPFGGPATSLLRVEFSAPAENATIMDIHDSTFGCLGDTASTAHGWRLLFENGFKRWIEQT